MSKRRRERGLFGQPIGEASDQEMVRIVKLALRLGKRHLADFSHPKSPRKFTQPQLFACLSASAHFVSRAGRKRTKFVKLMIGFLCSAVCPCALVVDWGPSHDMRQAWALREKMLAIGRPQWLGATARSTRRRGTAPTGKTGACRATPRPPSGAPTVMSAASTATSSKPR